MLVVAAIIACRRPSGPRYQGRTIEQWFEQYDYLWNASYYDAIRGEPRRIISAGAFEPGQAAFRAMGTNAVKYLVGRITQDVDYSAFDLWRLKKRRQLPTRLRFVVPMPRLCGAEAGTAANLLSGVIKPPGEMLVPLLESTLQSTNADRRLSALIAIRGISSGYALARPHVERALDAPEFQLQHFGADAVRWFGPAHGQWAVDRLLELADSSDPDVFESAVHGLNSLETNSVRVLPKLRDKLAAETNETRRQKLEHSVHYISEFAR